MKARRKVYDIEYELYDGTPESTERIMDMYGKMSGINNSDYALFVVSGNDCRIAYKGNYVILKDGELYPMRREEFNLKYEVIQ